MQPKMTISRAVIYAALILFALYFLFPLYVMLSTSFKDIDQLRTGNLLTGQQDNQACPMMVVLRPFSVHRIAPTVCLELCFADRRFDGSGRGKLRCGWAPHPGNFRMHARRDHLE